MTALPSARALPGLTAYACAVCLKDLTWGGVTIIARAHNPEHARETVAALFNLLPHDPDNPFVVTDITPLEDLAA